MPVSISRPRVLLSVGLALAYLVLAFGLNPVLLAHEFALPSDAQHGDSDVCTFLDHVAGCSLHSADVDLQRVNVAESHLAAYPALLVSRTRHSDPVRGPPVHSSSSRT